MKDGEPTDLRNWSVVPARSVGDKRLSHNDRLVLLGLGLYTNGAGVCWPTHETLQRHTKLGRAAVMAAIKRLEAHGYVRLLKPEYWPGQKSKWLTNRYQVLWRGKDPLPRLEELRDARLYNTGEDEDEDRAAQAEIAATSSAKPDRAYTEEEVRRIAALFNRALGIYGSFADLSLAASDAPVFLASLAGSDPETAIAERLRRYHALRRSVPSRLTQLLTV